MNGEELFSRVVTTIQEMHLKIGDSYGSVSLYYPYEGDVSIADGFRRAASDFPDMVLERLPQRLRVTVSEKDCARISAMPVKETIRDMVHITKGRADIDTVREFICGRYPESRMVRSGYIDFDWILTFPEGLDDDVYCLSEELGQVTYHRFSREEYLALGFEIPERSQHVQKYGQHADVDQVHEDPSDEGHQEVCDRGGSVLRYQCLDVGDGVGGGAHTETHRTGHQR